MFASAPYHRPFDAWASAGIIARTGPHAVIFSLTRLSGNAAQLQRTLEHAITSALSKAAGRVGTTVVRDGRCYISTTTGSSITSLFCFAKKQELSGENGNLPAVDLSHVIAPDRHGKSEGGAVVGAGFGKSRCSRRSVRRQMRWGGLGSNLGSAQ